MGCCGNQNEALGMPAGSVRALLGLFIIPPVVASSIALMLLMFFKEQYTSALGILSGLTGMAGLVVGFYFGNKSADKATFEIIRSHNTVNQAKDDLISEVVSEKENLLIANREIMASQREVIEAHRNVIESKNREIERNILIQNHV